LGKNPYVEILEYSNKCKTSILFFWAAVSKLVFWFDKYLVNGILEKENGFLNPNLLSAILTSSYFSDKKKPSLFVF
jgi:hypothetical protein